MIALHVVAEARSWIGTPYLHQASVKGAGADCLGLVRGIWRSLYQHEPEPVPPYTDDWAEPDHREVLLLAARRWLLEKPVARQASGDVLLFRMRSGSIAKHLGVQSQAGPEPRFIHAYTGHGVVENALSQPWCRRIAARFAFPEGAR